MSLSEYEIAVIMKQLLEGVQYLHCCGVMHRDLKPENILIEFEKEAGEENVSDYGTIKCVKITDFGLSKIISSRDPITDSCGTPAYVAPEILQK